jgi:hypothetical protein
MPAEETKPQRNENVKLLVVWLILDGKTEEALSLLAKTYDVKTPRLKVGLPKGRRKGVYGCYTAKDATIHVLDGETLSNPFVLLHEFYHHLRTSVDMQHKGTEKNADKFAMEFIEAYKASKKHLQE